jgi:hypothetical protein
MRLRGRGGPPLSSALIEHGLIHISHPLGLGRRIIFDLHIYQIFIALPLNKVGIVDNRWVEIVLNIITVTVPPEQRRDGL